MNILEINQQIIEAGSSSADKYMNTFLNVEQNLIENINSLPGLQTEIYMQHKKTESTLVQFVSIFSDFISLYMAHNHGCLMSFPPIESKFNLERRVTLTDTMKAEMEHSIEEILALYLHHGEEKIKSAIKTYEPILLSSKATLRPERALLIYQTPELKSKKYKSDLFYCQGNTSIDHWVLKDSIPRNSLPIEQFYSTKHTSILLDLTLPYFSDLDTDTLMKILDDESDLLNPFRKSLKKIIIEYSGNDKEVEEIRQDILQPEIDSINKKFKSINNFHRLNLAQGLGFFSLALVKVFVSPEQIFDFISGLMTGAGATKIMASEIEYQKSLNELRDNPYFLLWRLKKNPKL